MVKMKFKMKIILVGLIILFFSFFSGDVRMTGQLRWIVHMLRKLIDADSFIKLLMC
jgi:hypothetical protein